MIVSFKGKAVEAIAAGKALKGFPPDLVSRAERRLRAIDNAVDLKDLRSPPGNDQWRICFRWTQAGAEDVEIVDYH